MSIVNLLSKEIFHHILAKLIWKQLKKIPKSKVISSTTVEEMVGTTRNELNFP